MKRTLASIAIAVAALLASPAPAQQPRDAGEAPAGCAGSLVAPWMPAAGKNYRVAAVASGRSCAVANVVLTIRSADGATLLAFTSAAADLPLLFGEVATPATMMGALRRWIAQPRDRTTRELPSWPADAEEPGGTEQTFHPEPAISRARYADLRKWGQPMFCFLQGSESEACYALDVAKESMTLIGTRTLPG